MRVAAFAGLIALLSPVATTGATPNLTGAWLLVRADNVASDGSHIALYGSHPVGLLLLEADGHYAIQIASPDRPRFAAGDKAKGSPEEYRAASVGYNAHFGRYLVDAAAGVLTFRIETASFPNWEGATQVRRFTLEGDRLTYRVPTPTSGQGAVGEVEWRRAEPAR